MDETHLFQAIRYVTLNPVRAGLVKRAEEWPWSSARAHLAGDDNGVVKVAPVLERVGDFTKFLGEPIDEDAAYAPLMRAETIGRPVGDTEWLKMLEKQMGRVLMPQKTGRKPKKGLNEASP
ncbi:MAG: hypothetical protein P1V13_19010 [Rhizobiaceae bacterium]|nr:hypothetical protein [Rhizobiaceae bacterium]